MLVNVLVSFDSGMIKLAKQVGKAAAGEMAVQECENSI